MAVAYDAESESHTADIPSSSEASFSWTHTPSGTPAGVVVYTFVMNASGDKATAVTYGGSAMTAVPGGRAVDTAVEPGDCKLWFLGSSVPTGAQTVEVTRTNDTSDMYAVCMTVTASSNTTTAGILLEQEDQALTEENIDDGSPGSNSLRCVGIYTGAASPATAGANSTLGPSIDIGGRAAGLIYETTPGQGSRPVGGLRISDDLAAVYVAIIESAAATQNLTSAGTFTKAPTFPTGVVTPGAVALTGTTFTKAPTFPTGTIIASAVALTGIVYQLAPTFPTGVVTGGGVQALTSAGTFTKAPTFPTGAVTVGPVALTGTVYQLAPTFPTGAITVGVVALTGTTYQLAPVFPTGIIGQAGALTGIVYQLAPTFFAGIITGGTTVPTGGNRMGGTGAIRRSPRARRRRASR